MAPISSQPVSSAAARPEVRERSFEEHQQQQKGLEAYRKLQQASFSKAGFVERKAETPLDAATAASRSQTTPDLSALGQTPTASSRGMPQATARTASTQVRDATPKTAEVSQQTGIDRSSQQRQVVQQGLVERRVSAAQYDSRIADARARAQSRAAKIQQQRVAQNRQAHLGEMQRQQDDSDISSNQNNFKGTIDPFAKTSRVASASAETAAGLDKAKGSIHVDPKMGPQGQSGDAIKWARRATDHRLTQSSTSDTKRRSLQSEGGASLTGAGAGLSARASVGTVQGTGAGGRDQAGSTMLGKDTQAGPGTAAKAAPGQAVARRADTSAKWSRLVTEQEVVDSNFDGEYRRQLAYMRTLTGEAAMGLERDPERGVQVKSASELDLNEIFAFRQGATQKTARRKFAVYHGFSLLAQMIAFWIISRAAHDKIRKDLELKGFLGEFVPSLDLGDFVLEFVKTYEKAVAMAEGMPAEQARLLKTIENTVDIEEIKTRAREIRQKMDSELSGSMDFDSKR